MEHAQDEHMFAANFVGNNIRQACDYQFACALDSTGPPTARMVGQPSDGLVNALPHFYCRLRIVLFRM